MRGYSIKEVAGDVSIEWFYDVDLDTTFRTERVGVICGETEISSEDVPENVFMAFCTLLESVKGKNN